MIVRDAERSLGPALASARPFVDEIIVVDTGSLDGTRDVAAEHRRARLSSSPGAMIFRPPAIIRSNKRRATGSSGWTPTMCCPQSSGEELRRLIADMSRARTPPSGSRSRKRPQSPRPRSRVMGHAHSSSFPRHPRIRFRYRIHEQVAPAIRAGLANPPHQGGRVACPRRSLARRASRPGPSATCGWPIWTSESDPTIRSSGSAWERPTSSCRTACPAQFTFCGGASPAFGRLDDAAQRLPLSGPGPGHERRPAAGRASVSPGARIFSRTTPSLLMRLGHLCRPSRRWPEAAAYYQTFLERGRVRSRHPCPRRAGAGGPEAGRALFAHGPAPAGGAPVARCLKEHPQATAVQQALQRFVSRSRSIIVGPRT